MQLFSLLYLLEPAVAEYSLSIVLLDNASLASSRLQSEKKQGVFYIPDSGWMIESRM